MPQIKTHLLKHVPGLQSHGLRLRILYIKLDTVTTSIKSNCNKEYHPDAHFLFRWTKHRREFAALFDDEVTILSTNE